MKRFIQYSLIFLLLFITGLLVFFLLAASPNLKSCQYALVKIM